MQQHLYFLGIGGTLMGSLALLAKDLGHTVSGSDAQIYPPMSDLLANADITVHEGFEASQLPKPPGFEASIESIGDLASIKKSLSTRPLGFEAT